MTGFVSEQRPHVVVLDSGLAPPENGATQSTARRLVASWEGVSEAPSCGSVGPRMHAHAAASIEAIAATAPSATISTIAVLPRGDVVARIVNGLRWAANSGADIVCMPVGLTAENTVLAPLIGELNARGTLVIAAIGNRGSGRTCQPGLDPNVLAVGACDATGRVQSYSGSKFDPDRRIHKPDVLAESANGTSLACAIIAGMAAALLREHRTASGVEAGRALVGAAAPMASDEWHRAARGRVDLDGARRRLEHACLERPPEAPAPVRIPPWIDPRLRRQLELGDPRRPIRLVVARRETELIEAPRGDVEALLSDPDLVAASAADIAGWALAVAERLGR